MPPQVAVITPTWQRNDVLLNRCIPSVAAQDYPDVEHIVISDGPDDALSATLTDDPRITYLQLPSHDPGARWGHWARLAGIEACTADYIAYLDDDNSYRPDHVSTLMRALTGQPDAGFAYSLMVLHCAGNVIIGNPIPGYGQIDTSMLLHRRSILDTATWTQSLPTIDWDLVDRWMQAGIRWTFAPNVTADKY
jgi:glycosyltransferase involved in cell wall biosynthesis